MLLDALVPTDSLFVDDLEISFATCLHVNMHSHLKHSNCYKGFQVKNACALEFEPVKAKC